MNLNPDQSIPVADTRPDKSNLRVNPPPRTRPMISVIALSALLSLRAQPGPPPAADPAPATLMYHSIRVAEADGTILPWFSADLAESYDHVVGLTWQFWRTMRTDRNGLPYYMNHQVWRAEVDDPRGLGGDQLAMALCSFGLLYAYTGDEAVKEEMKFIADYYLTHSLSPPTAAWPQLPFPYNTLVYSGSYDGDMVLGAGYTQPDKAGSFGWELLKLYQMTENRRYLLAATAIADTLAAHTEAGDREHSPLPFKVCAQTGQLGVLKQRPTDPANPDGPDRRPAETPAAYTTNFAPTLELFAGLQRLRQGRVESYDRASRLILAWMKEYPLQTNRWGPFFEDIPGWSDTQINAVSFASFMLNHRELFPSWRTEVRGVLDWVYQRLGNDRWQQYGVRVVNEQTAYLVPGNSHTARQAAAELLYATLAHDPAGKANAIRQLSWATYMVDHDGKNCYPFHEIWMTDGYGDYIRHYLRAMAADPSLAPAGRAHLLSSTSVVQQVEYLLRPDRASAPGSAPVPALRPLVRYRTFDPDSTEAVRMNARPEEVRVGRETIPEQTAAGTDGWSWTPLETGGFLRIHHTNGRDIKILGH